MSLSPDATRWLAEQGYDEAFGARPLARVIQDKIKKPLADEILFGQAGARRNRAGDAESGPIGPDFDIIEAPHLPVKVKAKGDDADSDEETEPNEPELVK